MNTSESFRALRRANPRARAGFAQSVESVAERVREQIVATPVEQRASRRRLVGASAAGVSLVAAAVVVAFLTVGRGPGVEDAAAAIRKAAGVTAASAERSGTATVRVERDGKLWAGKTVRWNGADVAIVDDAPIRPRGLGKELRVVDGTMYGPDGDGGWLVLGSPASIDPDSGTTPGEHLAAVREDIGGVTLRRISDAMTGLSTAPLGDGSTVYRGTVAAGQIARESGFKEGRRIRVLPFGYVAHDEAADPASPLDVAVTVAADGVVREIAVSWGGGAAWAYTVTYSDFGTTRGPVAPEDARPLRR